MTDRLRLLSVVPGNPSQYTGCEYHRQIIPHYALDREYPIDIFQVDTIRTPGVTLQDGTRMSMDELIESCDVVHYGRIIDSYFHEEIIMNVDHEMQTEWTVKHIHDLGKPIILDQDDYWKLSSKHVLNSTFKARNVAHYMRTSAQLADHVTVTTPFLAEKVSEVNKNVSVLPNAIDPTEPQWQRTETYSDKLRFGWIGGACHQEDFEIMSDSMSKLWSDPDVSSKIQIVLAGFNVNDKTQVKRPDGSWVVRNIKPENCIYVQFEKLLTDNYRAFGKHPNYLRLLKLYRELGEKNVEAFSEKPYKRIWAVDTYRYGLKYNEWDVTFVPLNDNLFNNCKSQLKMIESGFMGKACIVSGIMPYTIDAKHMVNAYVIPPNKNHKWWGKAMKEMVNDRAMVKELAANLEKEMKEKYNISKVNEERWRVFCKVAGKEHLINHKKEAA